MMQDASWSPAGTVSFVWTSTDMLQSACAQLTAVGAINPCCESVADIQVA